MSSVIPGLMLIHQKTSQRYPLRGDFTIGRTDGDLVFDHDPKLSGKHCLIRLTESGYAIYDLKTRTGVFVNGQRLPGGKACILRPGAEITVGDQVFKVSEDARNPSVEPPRAPIWQRLAMSRSALLFLVLLGAVTLALPRLHFLSGTLSGGSAGLAAVPVGGEAVTGVREQPTAENLDAETREAMSRYDNFNRFMRPSTAAADYERNLSYLKEELVPRFTSLHNQMQTLSTPKDAYQAKRFDLNRRRIGAILGQVTAMTKYLETRDERYAREISEFDRELRLIGEQIIYDNRHPASPE